MKYAESSESFFEEDIPKEYFQKWKKEGRFKAHNLPSVALCFTVQPATHEMAGGRSSPSSSPEVAQQPQEQTKPSRPYMSVSVPAMQLLQQRGSEEPTARPSSLKRSASLALSLEMQWASICEAVSTPLWKSASVPKHLNLLSSACNSYPENMEDPREAFFYSKENHLSTKHVCPGQE